MQQPGLDRQHRDKNGSIAARHGNTPVSTLRKIYGKRFATGRKGHERLQDVLDDLDHPSFTKIVRDYEAFDLSTKISKAS